MAFESTAGVTGNVSVTVLDPAGIAPTTIIQTDHAWQVRVDWFIDGAVAPFIGGKWKVRVYAESLGNGEEKQIGDTMDVDLNTTPPLPTPRNYSTTVNIPKFSDDALKGLDAGLYRLMTAVLYENLLVPLEMAGFEEGPIVQIYEGQP
jgi:hypothetical protein